jgi:hypothetical protein
MFGKSGCKCYRCVSRRRLNFVLAVALFALIPIGYLALPDRWQSSGTTVSSPPRESPSELTESGPESIASPREPNQVVARATTPATSVAAAMPGGSITPQTKHAVIRVPSLEANSAGPAADSSKVAARPAIGNSGNGPATELSPQLKKVASANHAPSSKSEPAIIRVPSLEANPADPAADFSTIGAGPATGNSTNRPGSVSPLQLEKEALADHASLISRVAPQPAPFATPVLETLPSLSLATSTPAVQEDSGPHGYITVESKIAPPRTSPGTGHVQKPVQPSSYVKQTPLAPRQNFANSPDNPIEGRGQADKGVPSGELQRFALDFVQTDRSRNVASEHRFYAESVHFFNEGDLSWSGVAAATRRYHLENKQFQVAGRPVVQGPVNGGFYIIEQPVSWSQKNGSSFLHGRSVLRLRVLATGKAGWKITSIEELSR